MAGRASYPKLDAEKVRAILTSQESDVEVAAQFGVSRQTVSNVRRGESYRNFAPELERRPSKNRTHTCFKCLHWDRRVGYCDLGFPEPRKNIWFASECSLYKELNEVT
jgi:hypothetical protein